MNLLPEFFISLAGGIAAMVMTHYSVRWAVRK